VRFRYTASRTVDPTMTRIQIITDTSTKFVIPANTIANPNAGLNFNENAVGAPSVSGRVKQTAFSVLVLAPRTSIDVSSGIIAVAFYMSLGSNFKSIGRRTDGGGIFGLVESNTGRHKYWQIASNDTDDTSSTDLMVTAIQPGQSQDTASYKSTLAPSINPISAFAFGWYSKEVAVTGPKLSRLVHIPSDFHICGGGSTAPLSFGDIVSIANNYEFPLINKNTGIAVVPLRFGGTKKCVVDATLFSLRYLPQASLSNRYSKMHVDDGYLGVTIDARAGDTVKLTTGTISGGSKIKFNMLATCSASATYDFSGLSVINANVTLRPVVTFTSMQFIGCTTFAQNLSTITSCTLSGSTVSCDDPDLITNCSFTCEAEHALVLSATGTHNLFGNTFSGYGADGSSTAAIYNNSGGAVTLVLSEGDITPTVKNGAGASTTIQAPVPTATVTVKDDVTGSPISGVRVYLKTSGDVVVLSGLTDVNGVISAIWTEAYPVDVSGWCRKASVSPFYREGKISGTITGSGFSTTVLMIRDDQ
jgi:hypothetical protein